MLHGKRCEYQGELTLKINQSFWWADERRTRRGFTLLEVMVTMTIIIILIAIALPVLNRVRENARDVTCRSNLRQIGQALTQYSTRMQYLCSGAWDWKRDGAVTEVGWVADLVNQGTPVGDLLCPSSNLHVSGVYQQLLTMDPSTNTCADSLGDKGQTLPDGTAVPNPCRVIYGTVDKGSFLRDQMLLKGFNTNYAAGWFLVRSEVIIDDFGALVNAKLGCAKSPRERSCTAGPLPQARIGRTKVPGNLIPIMGCAGQAEEPDSVLSTQIDEHEAGEFVADLYSTGPRDLGTLKAPVISGSGTGIKRWFGPWNQTLQDYRAFAPQHFGQTSCNLLFLDGSVSPFLDTNGDHLLNNGFPASAAMGYTSDTIELPDAQVYSLWSLDPVRVP